MITLTQPFSVKSVKTGDIITDEELVNRIRTGDRDAFRMLVEQYEESVAITVLSMVGRSSDVDDIVQDVFIRFFKTVNRYRGDASLKTYLKKIAINRSLDVLRRRKKVLSRFLSRDDDENRLIEPTISGNAVLERGERDRLVQKAIASLPDKHRAVVVLRMIDGYSTEETAKMLDLAYGTVLSRLNRAMKKLKNILEPLVTEDD